MGARQSRLAKQQQQQQQQLKPAASATAAAAAAADQKPGYNFVITEYIAENDRSPSPLYRLRHNQVSGNDVAPNGQPKRQARNGTCTFNPKVHMAAQPPPLETAEESDVSMIGSIAANPSANPPVERKSAKRSKSTSAGTAPGRPCPVHGNYGLSPRRQQQQAQTTRHNGINGTAGRHPSAVVELEVDRVLEQDAAGRGTLLRGRRGAPPQPEERQHQRERPALPQRHQSLQRQPHSQRQGPHQMVQQQQQQQQHIHNRQVLEQQQQQRQQDRDEEQQYRRQLLERQQQQQQSRNGPGESFRERKTEPQPQRQLQQEHRSRPEHQVAVTQQNTGAATISRGRTATRVSRRQSQDSEPAAQPSLPKTKDDSAQTTGVADASGSPPSPPPQFRVTLRRSRSRSQRARDVPRLRLLPALSQTAAAAAGRGHRVIDSNPSVLYRPRYFAQRRSLVEGLERLHLFCDDDCADDDTEDSRVGDYVDAFDAMARCRPLVRRDSCPGKLNSDFQQQLQQGPDIRQQQHLTELALAPKQCVGPRRIGDVRHAAELRRRCRTFSAARQPRDGPPPKSPLPAARRDAGQRAFYFFHIRTGSLAQTESFLFDRVVLSLAGRFACTLRLLPPEEAQDLPDGLRRVEVAGPSLKDVKRFLYYLTTSEETVSLQKQIQERHTLSRKLSRTTADSRSETTSSPASRSQRDLSPMRWTGTPDTASSAGSQQHLWRTSSEAMRPVFDYHLLPSGYV